MPFTAPHMYLSILGDAYGGTERWQFGFRLTDGGISGQATANDVGPAIAAWYPVAANGFYATHRFTSVKVARIGVDGAYEPGTISGEWFPAAPVLGSEGHAVDSPDVPQLTVCCTLQTAVPRGRGARGRVYPPPQRWNIGADGLLAAGDAGVFALRMANLISTINARPLVGNVAVMSRGKGVPGPVVKGRQRYTYPNPGTTNNVTSVGVGRVVDTQRRRRRNLVESRQSSAVT